MGQDETLIRGSETIKKQSEAKNELTLSAQQDLETRLSRFELMMIILTIMGVVVAAITGFVFWQQLRVMAGQLREMQSGGVDTHALALAAESQTTALKAQSENTARLAGFANSQVAKLEALGVATIAQNNVLSGQLETTKLAVDANRNQFQIDQRAWVGLSSFIV